MSPSNLRPKVDILYRGSRKGDILKRRVSVLKNLTAISRAIGQLSIRQATDPDADEYMRKQFIFALSGGSDSHQKGLQMNTEIDAPEHQITMKELGQTLS